MTQPRTLYGYRLHGNDNSASEWRFFDDWQDKLVLSLRLKNGAVINFAGSDSELGKWAQVREILVERAEFMFDPHTMTFTEIK
jgi:hypothetical protein